MMRTIRRTLWNVLEVFIIGLTLILIGLASFILRVDTSKLGDGE